MTKRTVRFRIILAVLSGGFLGLSFPPVPTGVLIFVAFVPFFILLESIERYGEAFMYSFITFFVFNLLTLYWVGSYIVAKDLYLMVAAAILILIQPFFFYIPIAAWIFLRKRFGFRFSISSFPVLWIAFEYLHSLYQVANPWLTIANSQTYDLAAIQIAEYTGVFGVSLWIMVINLIAYLLYAKIALREWRVLSVPSLATAIGIVTLYFLPRLYGTAVIGERSYLPSPGATTAAIGIIQPDIDPYEKWEKHGKDQLATLLSLTSTLPDDSIDLVVWPETSVPFYILLPENEYDLHMIRGRVETLRINLFAGITDLSFYGPGEQIPGSSKRDPEGRRYDIFNTGMLLQPGDSGIQKYNKRLLVPFAERVPYAEELSFLDVDALRWNFGTGGYAIGNDTTVFNLRTRKGENFTFSSFICFESIFSGYVADFVRKGAELIIVISNDSWYGRTSGPIQHKQFEIFRAVENRRWLVRCANGGISCIIDPYGRILQETELFTQRVITGSVEPRKELTFYTRFGDWIGVYCLIGSILMLGAGGSSSAYRGIRRRQALENHRFTE